MTNQVFGSSSDDSPAYCDNNNMNSSLIINGDLPPAAVVVFSNGTTKDPLHQHQHTNSISMVVSNQEKPPYSPTVEEVECQERSNSKQQYTSIWHVLHLIAVVVASSTINGVVFGVVNNFGVFYVYLIELFKADTSLLTLSGTEEPLTSDNTTASPADSTLLQPLIGKCRSHSSFDISSMQSQ